MSTPFKARRFTHSLYMFIALTFLFLTLPHDTQALSWSQLTVDGTPPSERADHTAVYDTVNNIMIVFGGNNSITANNKLWVLSTANGLGGTPAWTQLSPTGSAPTSRDFQSAGYDNTNNRMTIFGGYSYNGHYLNDVWVLSTANGLGGTPAWIQLSPTPDSTQTTNGYGGLPASRYGHTGVYDAINNRMTIFGGYYYDTTNNFLNDVWVLSHANGLDSTTSVWTRLSPTGSAPTTRYLHTAVYDTTNNRMIVFGGLNNNYLNDVWVLSNANGLGGTPSWTQLSTTGSAPTSRYWHSAIYDNNNNCMTIFGGIRGGSSLNDVWVLTNANGLGGTPAWTQIVPTGSTPTTRNGNSAVYDPMNNRMIIFGGEVDYSIYLNDAWVLDFNPSASFNISELNSYGPLTVNFTDTSLGLGGNSTTWNWNFGDGNMSNLQNPQHIYQSVSTTTTYTIYEIVSTLFGMSTASTSITVTEPSYISWIEQFPSGNTPSGRTEHTVIYDTNNNRMTLFGGYDGTNLLNDVWVLSTANGLGGIPAWAELSPTPDSTYGFPTARFHHTAVYDSVNNRMVIFGGSVGSGISVNDVWVLSTANGLGTSAWTKLLPTGSAPTTRHGHTAVFDTANNLMIIFGGQASVSYLNDVWVLSTANGLGTSAWTQLSPTPDSTYGIPTARFSHTSLYDSANNRMIIFGGWYGYKECLNDVWVLSTANGLGGTPAWTKLNPIPDPTYGFPTVRYGHTAVYDAPNNRMIIFAGTPPNLGNADVNDTWVLNHANGLGGTPAWSLVSTLGVIPNPRQYHTAVYDATNKRMTIFGGADSTGKNENDVWVLNNGDTEVPIKDWMLYSTESDKIQ